MLRFLLPFVSSFTFVYMFIPVVKRWAYLFNILDRPSSRKKHRGVIPLTGGLAIFLGVMPLVFIFLGWNRITISFLLGGLLMVGIGTKAGEKSSLHGQSYFFSL